MAYCALLYTIIGGIFRHILGKQFYIGKVKISRFYKLVVLVLLCLSMYLVTGNLPILKDWKGWLSMAWAIGWVIRFNSHTHGDYWILDNTGVDEERSWWVGKVLTLLFGKGGYYNFEGNFIGLTLGYLVPALMASLTMPHHWFWTAGFAIPVGYLICEFTLEFTGKRTKMAEYANGAMMFLLFFVNLI